MGDPVNNADGSLNATALRNWYLAQYTLAPVVLSRIPGQRLFLMNNSAEATDSGPHEEGSFTTQELGHGHKILNFGNGVKLLSSEPQ